MTFPTAAAMTTRRRSFTASAGAVITPLVGGGGSSVPPKWHLVKVPPRLTAVRVLEGRFGAVLHAELREQVLHEEFDGVVRKPEPLRDLGVGEPAGDQRPNLALARRQVARRPAPRAALDPTARGLRKHELTGVHLPDRRQRLLGRLGLQREAFSPGVECRAERLAVVVGGEH